jgi:hypothetical protein
LELLFLLWPSPTPEDYFSPSLLSSDFPFSHPTADLLSTFPGDRSCQGPNAMHRTNPVSTFQSSTYLTLLLIGDSSFSANIADPSSLWPLCQEHPRAEFSIHTQTLRGFLQASGFNHSILCDSSLYLSLGSFALISSLDSSLGGQ